LPTSGSVVTTGQGQLADGTTYRYWTFNGKVPGPFVRVRVGEADLLTLDLHASVVARLDTVLSTTGDAPTPESDTEDSDEADGAGPLTLAIELKDDEADTGPEPAAAA